LEKAEGFAGHSKPLLKVVVCAKSWGKPELQQFEDMEGEKEVVNKGDRAAVFRAPVAGGSPMHELCFWDGNRYV